MYNNPETLKQLCIDYVCKNKYILLTNIVFLPTELSEILLTKLSLLNELNDETLLYFSKENVYLRNFILPDCKKLTKHGLSILQNHKIKKIEAYGLNCPINVLVDSLSEWSIKNLESLCVSKIAFKLTNLSSDMVTASLSKLNNLRALDVSFTGFTTKHLSAVVEDLPHLELLNISNTHVNSFLPFKRMTKKLQILKAFNLKEAIENVIDFDHLKCLTSLTHLDLSIDWYQFKSSSYKTLLADPNWLPNLVALDISGSDSVGSKILENFLNTHKNLRFLGLTNMEDCGLKIFTNPSHPLFNPDLVVTGYKTQMQLVTGLKLYGTRINYINFYLTKMFKMFRKISNNYASSKNEIIQLVLDLMHCFSNEFLIQISGTACLCSLLSNIDLIHPSILVGVVEVVLKAMARYPNTEPLQRNALLVLCNGHILLNVKMDKFKCAKIVLNSLYSMNDDVLNHISIIIFCTIVPKLSFPVTSYQLEYYSHYMFILLRSLRNKVTTGTFDLTMKLILNALRCLTGESFLTCQLFVDKGGLQIFIHILHTYTNNGIIDLKVLLIVLNNIVTIPHLRAILLCSGIISPLRRLLRSEKIDLSYYAAGIVAHLACEFNRKTCKIVDKAEILEELRFAIKQWVRPEEEVVVYKSLHFFIGILNSTSTPQAQLWAAWALLHACTINAKKYCPMLDKEIGVDFLQSISSNKSVDQDVRELCNRILDVMKKFQ